MEKEAESAHLEVFLHHVQNLPPDADALMGAHLLSMEDDHLANLLKQLTSAERRLTALQNGKSPIEASLEDTRELVAGLNSQIQGRTAGLVRQMQTKLAALKLSLEGDEGK